VKPRDAPIINNFRIFANIMTKESFVWKIIIIRSMTKFWTFLGSIEGYWYYRSGTGVRCCIGAGYRHFMFSHQVAALFCVKWHRCQHLEITTSDRKSDSSIDAYLRKEKSCQILFRSDLKRRSLRLFGEIAKQQQQEQQEMSSDMRSVPDRTKII